MKRTIDSLLSFFAIITLLPVVLMIALLIKLSAPGPVFFRQSRVGLHKRKFNLVKFRTMVQEADQKGPLVTAKNDTRITPIGRILRRTKLDELPTLWNVFIGDMSLVGPRPEAVKYVEHYHPEWIKVFSVRPGITDLATLQFRDEESVLEYAKDRERAYFEVVLPIKMKLALEYVEKQSILLDLKILFLTVWGITLGRVFAKPDNSLALKAINQIKQQNKSLMINEHPHFSR